MHVVLLGFRLEETLEAKTSSGAPVASAPHHLPPIKLSNYRKQLFSCFLGSEDIHPVKGLISKCSFSPLFLQRIKGQGKKKPHKKPPPENKNKKKNPTDPKSALTGERKRFLNKFPSKFADQNVGSVHDGVIDQTPGL